MEVLKGFAVLIALLVVSDLMVRLVLSWETKREARINAVRSANRIAKKARL